ncbi:aminoacyl tRNA synthase complex-interacting multifunctional protein 2-like [Portunus trituberculatus]|uniref:aminoacyl tRNA synthase complex-interacting multifunctional protein 2-like n=1 Tax=Portunus trituberculatus TaxID=210409 RepID=UPI001E1CC9C1|nr:aminoacyl tRNA synthase complex-interacting multifunctional protein 2-like [Portunus trituberculatus]XP_045126557.1 aminoacyl tRNA synthase complex-interacting multifunctional protein 2-like [Portunus trituberculatus]
MYRCPKLVDVPVVVELPSVMYKMAPFSLKSHDSSPAQLVQTSKGCPAASALEARQEAVLKRLQNLKDQLDHLQSTRTTTATAAATTAAAAAATAGGLGAAACSSPLKTPSSPIQDLVIAASPASPPLSLLVLRRLLGQSGLPVHCSSRLHSSVPQVRPELQAAFTESPLEERSKHSVAFSLQWSDVPSPSLMINPLRQTRIAGEANILRYVTRLLPSTSPYNFEATGTFTSIAETDSLLDTLEGSLVWGGAKERAAVMREIGKRLSRSAFLCGGQCGVVDLLAWSLVRQRGGAVDQAIGNWLARVDALAGIDLTKITTTTTTATKQQQKSKPQPPAQTTTTTTKEGGEKKISPQNEKTYLGRKDLEKYLKELGVAFQIKEHQAVMTVEALMGEVEGLPGIITKNLFLRDKKKTLYILSTRHDTEIDLKTLAKKINAKDLRFADGTTLYDTLGVRQGCVTPLALINDPGHTVKVLLETPLMELATGHIYFHPLSNDASLGLKPAGLQRFLEATGHAPPTLVQL